MTHPHRPLFSWLRCWSREELHGELTDIFIVPQAGAPPRRVTHGDVLPGRGLAGDRYAVGTGHWRHPDACQVTLVTAEDLDRAERRGGIPFGHGEHRRNLVIRGIPLEAFRHRKVRIGPVLFAFHRLRPPCGYLERIYRPGAIKALGRGAGIGLHALESGTIRVGDPVEVMASPRDGPS